MTSCAPQRRCDRYRYRYRYQSNHNSFYTSAWSRNARIWNRNHDCERRRLCLRNSLNDEDLGSYNNNNNNNNKNEKIGNEQVSLDNDNDNEDEDDLMLLGNILDDMIPVMNINGITSDEPTEEELIALEEELAFLIMNESFDDDHHHPDDIRTDRNSSSNNNSKLSRDMKEAAAQGIERALMSGVVPARAGVGSKCLPGDYGFDPLDMAKKDYFKLVQHRLKSTIQIIPSFGNMVYDDEDEDDQVSVVGDNDNPRPTALILRDYREAEIRHGRLSMLAALIWPLQEIIDRVLIPSKFGDTTFIYGGITLPYLPLFTIGILLLLGYLDIYSVAVKEMDAGEAFLPGECFWDPLCILEGAPDEMKTNMQRREINNGRIAMVAVAIYMLEEGITHKPIISLPFNEYLFEPAFFIPSVRFFLDQNFAEPYLGVDQMLDPVYRIVEEISSDSVEAGDTVKEMILSN